MTVLNTGNEAVAQRYASESYNPYSPWNQAGDGDYWMKRCDICRDFVSGRSEEECDRNLANHKKECHTNKEPEEITNDYTEEDGIESEEENLGFSYASYVVDINDVAYALESMFVCNAAVFLEDYDAYYGNYVTPGFVTLSLMDSYLKRYTNTIVRHFTFVEIIERGFPFLILTVPTSQEMSHYIVDGAYRKYLKLKLIIKDNINNVDNLHIEYYYVFNRMQ